MKYPTVLKCLSLGVLIAIKALPAYAKLTAEPFGFSANLAADDTLQVPLTLHNGDNADLAYIVQMDEVKQGHRDGPRRDEPGDEITSFNKPGGIGQWSYCSPIAWDWDNDRMAVTLYNNGQMHWLTHDADYNVEDVATWQNGNWMDGCWLNGITYVAGLWNLQGLRRYDADGGQLQDINLNYTCYGVAADVEENRLFCLNVSQWPYSIDVYQMDNDNNMGDHLGTISNWEQYLNNEYTYSIEWVPKHKDGKLWAQGYGSGNAYEISVNEENWEPTGAAQNFHVADNPQPYDAIAHDGYNMWASGYGMNDVRVYDDGILEPYWFTLLPEEGVVSAGQDAELTATFNSTKMTDGAHEMNVHLFFTGGDTFQLDMSAVLTVGDKGGDIYGAVTDAENGNIIPGARVDWDRYLLSRYSGDDGNYRLVGIPFGNYSLAYSARDFLPQKQDMTLDQAQGKRVDAALLHSECTPDVGEDGFLYALQPDETADLDFSVTNGGNGPLTYTVDRRLPGEANAAPWELRHTYPTNETFNNTLLNGVAFVDSVFYIAGGGAGQKGKIYIMDRDGNSVGQFSQWIASQQGMRDLTYDGELLWGVDGATIVGFTTGGDSVTSLKAPDNPTYGLTWDPDRSVFWCASRRNGIKALDRDGNEHADMKLGRPGDSTSVYGLAYYPQDPDGYPLWAFITHDKGSNGLLAKYNPDTKQYMIARDLDDGSGKVPRGLFITSQFDVYSWVMMSLRVENGGQLHPQLSVWQIDARKNWMAVNPSSGVIDAGGTQNFVLTLNSEGLPTVQFNGEVVFVHDGVHGETAIPVMLEVSQGRVEGYRRLNMHLGWNLVSVSLQPDSADMPYIMQPLVDAGKLKMVKDQEGNFYLPEEQFNNIAGWDVAQAYWVKLIKPGGLTLTGITAARDDTIHLTEGWHSVAYYPRFPIDATIALAGIADHLVIAKNWRGDFYIPSWDFNSMGQLMDGQGYQMKVDADVDLAYQFQLHGAPPKIHDGWNQIAAEPQALPVLAPTGVNHSFLIMAEDLDGDVGVYASGRLVGSGVIQNGACGVPVWGDDPATPAIDGAVAGEPLEIRMPNRTIKAEILQGELVYRTDSFTAARLTATATAPTEFGIVSAYPNPFNQSSVVSYQLSVTGDVTLSLYDMDGRLVQTLARGAQTAGTHQALINGRDLSSGVYLVQLKSAGRTARQKIALVK